MTSGMHVQHFHSWEIAEGVDPTDNNGRVWIVCKTCSRRILRTPEQARQLVRGGM